MPIGLGLSRPGVVVGLWCLNAAAVWMVSQVWHDWLPARGKPSPSMHLLVVPIDMAAAGSAISTPSDRVMTSAPISRHRILVELEGPQVVDQRPRFVFSEDGAEVGHARSHPAAPDLGVVDVSAAAQHGLWV
jgi:hypothetical protein